MGVRYEGAWSDPDVRGVVVICPKCGMRTQLCRSREEVTALWNRRDGDAELATLNEAQALAIQQLTTQLTQAQEDVERSRLDICCHAGDEAELKRSLLGASVIQANRRFL